MEAFLYDIIELLITIGPLVVFVVAMVETAFFIGLLIPAEATVLVAAFLASRGRFEIEDVLLATIGGALAGDQIGYALGRIYGKRVAVREGRIGRLWLRYEGRATSLFKRKSVLAISAARFISFVRTLMPWFAGMTRMPYGTFLAYDLIGVIGWGTASVAAGYMAGESWRVLAAALGSASTAIIVLLVVFGLFATWRRRSQDQQA